MIDSFKGDYSFLSNFYPVPITYDGLTYKSVEHAYHAAKTLNMNERAEIWAAPDAVAAKKLGQRVTLRPDWEEKKLELMEDFLRQKFSQTEVPRGYSCRVVNLRQRLLDTGTEELVEGNWWNDTYWGVCKGVGENHLGKLLMKIREELHGQGLHDKAR